MKKFYKNHVSLLMILFLTISIIIGLPAEAATKKTSLSASTKRIAIDKSFALKMNNPVGKITWSVSNRSVAQVRKASGKNGQTVSIIAVGIGTTKVSAKDEKTSKVYTCRVTVYDPIKINGVSTITYGDSKTLSIKGTSKTPSWSSMDSNIVSIKKTSKYKAKITARSVGKTYIKVVISGRTYTHAVTVKEKTGKLKIAVAKCTTGEDLLAASAIRMLGASATIVSSVGSVNDYDGLVVPGGVDINPSRYHDSNTSSRGVNNNLDKQQLAILDKFVKAKKPVLGICRGEQLINVYFGGSLIQHVAGHAGIYHDVKNVSGSIMYRLYGKTTKVYSSHHQAVRRLGKGLKITQKANDGTVEAIEHKTLPIFAVQWHPELMGKSGQPVLKEFLTQCKSHRKAG